jgi:diguanylate cyclase (GGDEF)-like protein
MDRADPRLTLLEATRIVARGGELDAKLDALAGFVCTAGGARAALIYLLDPVAGELLPAAQCGLDETALDPALAVALNDGSELVAAAVRERRLSDAAAGGGSAAFVGRGLAGSLVAVPLIATDESGGEEAEGGLLAAFDDTAADPASPDNPLTALADLAAIAIRNARLANALVERSDWLERVASSDSLTGLANRATLLRMLELEIARATRQRSPLSLLVFDVDGFASLNERAGAEVGDDVLRLVASTLADQVRVVDTIGRLGPDEFGLIAPGSGWDIVGRRVIEAAGRIEAGGGPISLSAGAATLSEAAPTADELLAAAITALEQAKAQGPGQLAGA